MRLSNVLLIPAYRPGPELPEIVKSAAGDDFREIIVVDDGSGPAYASVFSACQATVLRHERNLGKGAALRTGMSRILSAYPDCGAVTADADGQHHPEDIRRVARRLAREPHSLVLGSRGFDTDVPGRSRAGNALSSAGFRLLMGQKLRDTQTGLRGIPRTLLTELVSMTSSGYEFEVDMLTAAKHLSIPIAEEPIRTIYEPGNPTSHFNPFKDSMRIGFVLARFTMLSLATAVLDNLVFSLAIRGAIEPAVAQILGRAAAVLVNYPLARRAVFLSKEPHSSTLLRYLALVAASGLASFQLLNLIRHWFGLNVLDAKMAAEALLFIVNFVVQRDWVFVSRNRAAATDWDGYYRSPAPTAHVTRKYTGRALVDALRRFGGTIERLVEFGGANSCFLEKISAEVSPREYHVVDTNAYGLSLLNKSSVTTHLEDCRTVQLELQADAAFSIGLIEHFDPVGTRQAILAHFRLLKPGGCAIISFPTPTWLYRAARWLAESAGAWKFPDERPLDRAEVVNAVGEVGRLEFERVLWPIVFTQRLMVFRKNP